MARLRSSLAGYATALLLTLSLGACAPNRLITTAVADQLASQGSEQEEDLELARAATPFFLKFSESVLEKTPDHVALAETVSAAFVRYAWAFVAFDAERLDGQNAAAAVQLRERAIRLYVRAQAHAERALNFYYPALRQRLALDSSPSPALVIEPRHAGLAYWLTAAWGARIALSKGSAEAIADLPAVIRLADALAACCLSWGNGAVASLRGSLEAGRPGGDRRAARAWFDQAERLSGGTVAAVVLARAEALESSLDDRAEFERLVRQSMAIAERNPGAENRIMLERARWLLSTMDERF